MKIFRNYFFRQQLLSIPDDDISPQRSPAQAVLSAAGMVIWVMFWIQLIGNFTRQ